MNLNYSKLKPYKFTLEENEHEYFINIFNSSINEIRFEKQKSSWIKRFLFNSNKIDLKKVSQGSISIDILNKYMKVRKDIIFESVRFKDIRIGTINQDNYESCLDCSCLIHKLLVIIESTYKFRMSTEVLFTQDDGTVIRKEYILGAGDAILLRPHNVVTPVEGGDILEESEDEEESEDNEDESEENEDEEEDDESNKNIKEKNKIKYLIIDIYDKNGSHSLDDKYYY